MANFFKHLIARAAAKPRHFLPIDEDLPFVGMQNPQHAFDHHRFARTGAADHHQRVSGLQHQIDPIQHDLVSEALLHASKFDLGSVAAAGIALTS